MTEMMNEAFLRFRNNVTSKLQAKKKVNALCVCVIVELNL